MHYLAAILSQCYSVPASRRRPVVAAMIAQSFETGAAPRRRLSATTQNPSTQANLSASRTSCGSNACLAQRQFQGAISAPKRAILARNLAHRATLAHRPGSD